MSDQTRSDLPWNDAPDDDAVVPGGTEPEPAEVVGSDENPRDLAARPIPDPNTRETLDERLAEEEPDRPVRRSPAGSVRLIDDEDDDDGDDEAEPDNNDDDDDEDDNSDLSAEEAAIHVVDE